MECNFNDIVFDNYFAALLTPIEFPENDNIVDKLPPIHTLGATHTAVSNLFSSINNNNNMLSEYAEFAYLKPIKTEENCNTDLSSSSANLDDNFLEDTNWLDQGKIPENPESFAAEGEINGFTDSPISNSISDEEVISSPVPIKPENVIVASKEDKKSPQKKNPKEKKSPKRSRETDEQATPEGGKKKRRTNYCFDIHRVYCSHTKKEKYYCNVTLQGKMQETVDLVKGKRGKYAYTFYDYRKQRKERRYWPSQSCGPVLEDNCSCKHCNVDTIIIKKVSCAPETKREIFSKVTPSDDNCILILEDVFLDM